MCTCNLSRMILDDFEAELKACKKAIQSISVLKSEVQDMKALIKYQDSEIMKSLVQVNKNSSVEVVPTKSVDVPVINSDENQENLLSPKGIDSTATAKQMKRGIPKLDYLTEPEFSAVPKYMKGRMQMDCINKLVDNFNKTIEEKYKILQTRRSKLSENNMKLHKLFKSQECDETRGIYFCLDTDLKHFTHVKTDKQLSNCFNILRHCGRINDIRSAGGIVRHAIIASNIM